MSLYDFFSFFPAFPAFLSGFCMYRNWYKYMSFGKRSNHDVVYRIGYGSFQCRRFFWFLFSVVDTCWGAWNQFGYCRYSYYFWLWFAMQIILSFPLFFLFYVDWPAEFFLSIFFSLFCFVFCIVWCRLESTKWSTGRGTSSPNRAEKCCKYISLCRQRECWLVDRIGRSLFVFVSILPHFSLYSSDVLLTLFSFFFFLPFLLFYFLFLLRIALTVNRIAKRKISWNERSEKWF